MNMNCEIILDLAGRYLDGTASSETVRAVREHLAECPDCARFYRQFSALNNQKNVASASDGDSAADGFIELARRIRTRRTLTRIGVGVYAAAAAGIVAAVLAVNHVKRSRRKVHILSSLPLSVSELLHISE